MSALLDETIAVRLGFQVADDPGEAAAMTCPQGSIRGWLARRDVVTDGARLQSCGQLLTDRARDHGQRSCNGSVAERDDVWRQRAR